MALLPRKFDLDIPPPAPLPPYLARRGRVGEGRSLKLKRVLLRHGLTITELASNVQQAKGRALSRPAAQTLVTYGLLPTKTPFDDLRAQVNAWLVSKGVPAEEIATAFDVEDAVVELYAHPSDRTTGNDEARALEEQLRRAGVSEEQISLTLKGLQRATRAPRERAPASPPPVQPLRKTMLSPAAMKHFGLAEDPFTEEIHGAEDIFRGSDVNENREHLWRWSNGSALGALIGESGSGKSWLRQDLENRILQTNEKVRLIRPVTIDVGRLNSRGICEAIILELAPGTVIPATSIRLTGRVKQMLIDEGKAGWRCVLVIEEAHRLTIDALRDLKAFYELQDGFRRLLSVVLIGQNPEMDLLLNEIANPKARELIKRVTRVYMKPLHANALKPYLAHKFSRAGADVARVLDDSAYSAILADRIKIDTKLKRTYNDCYPLAVQNLLTLAMNEAAALGAARVNADIVASAVKSGGR